MKLKYYLRGIGIGVIVATIIMTVSSSIHNNNLSRETIIKEAQKLGMVMPDNTEDKTGLWAEDTEVEEGSEVVSENPETEADTTETEADFSETEVVEDTQIPENENIVVITVEDSDAARQVAEKLFEQGLIDDAESFRLYLGEKGYASRIISGSYQIPRGSTYEEICDIIIK